MILAFFSSARMILSECHESPAFIHGFLHRLIPGIGGSNRAVPWRNDNRAKSLAPRASTFAFFFLLTLWLLLHRLGFLELLRLGKFGVLVFRSTISSRPCPRNALAFLGRWMHCNLLLLRITALPKPFGVLSVIFRCLRSFVVR